MPDLRPYQHTAADFLFSRDRAMILAPVGAGKTAITLAAMTEMTVRGHCDRWLVLAPKRVCLSVWPVEGQIWCPEFKISVAVGTPAQRKKAFESESDIVVTNYDNISSIDPKDFDGIVFDELTRLKNPSGKRFKHLMKILDQFKIRWGLTGSFTSNGLEDVFGQCKVVDQTLLGRSKGAFLQQYFYCVNRDYGEWSPLPGALPKVMDAIKPATYVLEPGEYKDKLPPLHVVEMRCELDDRAPYEAMKKDYVHEEITAPTAAALTNKLQQLTSGFAYGPEGNARWFGRQKFDTLQDILDENQHDNTIVFYTFREELAELKRLYPHAQTLDDPNAIERWNNKQIEILLAHPKSAQFGLNLQFGGCKMVFMSLPWSLIDFEQAIGRLHRNGQKHDVWVYVIMARNTIDEKIFAALHDKKSISEIALEALK